MKRASQAVLCPELEAVLQQQLALGNQLEQAPLMSGWPEARSVFVALRDALHAGGVAMPSSVRQSICSDLHYGWRDECYCELHGHLLVAGRTESPRES